MSSFEGTLDALIHWCIRLQEVHNAELDHMRRLMEADVAIETGKLRDRQQLNLRRSTAQQVRPSSCKACLVLDRLCCRRWT